jgi:hypothetical protein
VQKASAELSRLATRRRAACESRITLRRRWDKSDFRGLLIFETLTFSEILFLIGLEFWIWFELDTAFT